MFTGLVETIGTIRRVVPRGGHLSITVVPDIPFKDVHDGESIALSGPCLTVVAHDAESFTVEASPETLKATTLKRVRPGNRVNLERAMRADARLGGHFVAGHIDGTLEVRQVAKLADSVRVTIDLPRQYRPYVVDRGSVALDGISLTIIGVESDRFTVNLIPETQKRTTWGRLRAGDEINVEFDLVGKYILRFLEFRRDESGLTIERLRHMGY